MSGADDHGPGSPASTGSVSNDVGARSRDSAARTRPLPLFRDPEEERGEAWQLVVVWHPERERIGAVADLLADGQPDAPEFSIGRHSPVFRSEHRSSLDIADVHVSRDACQMRREDDRWVLHRHPGTSRLRVNGASVSASLTLAPAQLKQGFFLALADQVLLHVRQLPRDRNPLERPVSDAGLLGVSRAMGELRQGVMAAARSGEDVLLIGSTGTGKELVARALHELGPRSRGPWVPVNMAAIPVDLAAASLFGARRGAFTGADAHRDGFFQRAAGGTLFLDEIGDASADLQPLLLRALQEREVQTLGGPAEQVELGVVAAMERDPDDPDFGFRQALRYRLAGRELRLPDLAERAEDIGLLLLTFLERRGCFPHREALDVVDNARWVRFLECLMGYPWPGNVRELEHLAGELATALEGGGTSNLGALQRRFSGDRGDDPEHRIAEDGSAADAGASPDEDAVLRLADFDDAAFAEAWSDAGFEVAAMARQLGVSRAAVYRRIRSSPSCRLAADIPLVELLRALDACRGDLIATAQRLRISRRGLQARLRAGGMTSAASESPNGDGPSSEP